MNPVSEDIKDKLVELGVGKFAGTGSGWSIETSKEPDKPNNVVTIYDTPGRISKAYNHNRHGYFSGFLVRVRGASYLEAKKKIDDVVSKLDRIGKFVAEDMAYDNILISEEPIPLRQDEQGRQIWTVNGVAVRQKKPA